VLNLAKAFKVREQKLDILVNMAGVFYPGTFQTVRACVRGGHHAAGCCCAAGGACCEQPVMRAAVLQGLGAGSKGFELRVRVFSWSPACREVHLP
jgi:hypothetical protein